LGFQRTKRALLLCVLFAQRTVSDACGAERRRVREFGSYLEFGDADDIAAVLGSSRSSFQAVFEMLGAGEGESRAPQ
jgi:hypothetical protein